MTPSEILNAATIQIVSNIIQIVGTVLPTLGGLIAFFIGLKFAVNRTKSFSYGSASDETLMDMAAGGDALALEEIDSRQFPEDHDRLYQDGIF